MSFVAIILGLGLLQYLGSAKAFHQDGWFIAWQGAVTRFTQDQKLHFLFSVAVPLVLVTAIFYSIKEFAWGLGELVMSLVLFMYALGRGEFSDCFAEYIDCLKQGDTDRLVSILQKMDADYVASDKVSLPEAHFKARELFMYTGFHRVFVVLFWFALTGPFIAFFYRIVTLYLKRFPHNALAELLVKCLEWPAGRVYSATVSFVGDFAKSMTVWVVDAPNLGVSSKAIVHDVSLAALDLDMCWQDESWVDSQSSDALLEQAQDEIREVQSLIGRCLIFAIAGMALFQIII